jgi:hypothetical protein
MDADRDPADSAELPDHEQDDSRSPGPDDYVRDDLQDGDRDTDAADDAGLPAHEDDATRSGDTGTGDVNP